MRSFQPNLYERTEFHAGFKYQELAEPLPRRCEVDDRTKYSVAVPFFAKPRKPSQDHPWRRDYRTMKPNWRAKAEMPARAVARVAASL